MWLVSSSGRPHFMYILILASLQLWGRLSASTFPPPPPSPPPAPTLEINLRSKDSLVLVCRAPEGHHGVVFMLYRVRKKVDSRDLQSGADQVQFTVRMRELGSDQNNLYCCQYKNQEGHYSVVSSYLELDYQKDVLPDILPVPTLALDQQTDVWHLLCTGSPAYPGAVFSLFLADQRLPVATLHAKVIQHQVIFPVPVQDTPVALYQCQYSILLAGKWSNSERSIALAVTRGSIYPLSTDSSHVDWPLVLGSFSAVVLFLCSLIVVAVVGHKKVKAAAEEKKKREEAQFWTQLHAKDHIVVLNDVFRP
ncbi:uncharacterized protein LOC125000860 isoform X2 [Mugil cephalus]|uniref:uncharacterized protein LOC125000860 isoform X2 n=1 Tax=Mugil cephalus TaxID=48193 RepID=UPI001FB5EA9A|nr:uncharacterized protein LOC125000860 isoform X2 [Mugil cephalus]